jgi:biotin operon repressor
MWNADTNSVVVAQVEEMIRNASSEKPVTEREMTLRLGYPNRTIRRAIERIRHNGVRVITVTKGYFIAENENQYRAWRASYIHRAVNILGAVRAMDGVAEGQVALDGLCYEN